MFPRKLTSVLFTLAVAAGAVLAAAAPAQAREITCDSRIEWYQNRVEVVAQHYVFCNTTSPQIVAAIRMTRPVSVSSSRGCVGYSTCTATVGTSNRSGFQQYCAETGGQYMWRGGNPAIDSRPLVRRSSCITA